MALTRHPDDRRCAHTDNNGTRCITVLCVYNQADECYTHRTEARADDEHRRGRVDRGLVLHALQELMAQDDQRIAA